MGFTAKLEPKFHQTFQLLSPRHKCFALPGWIYASDDTHLSNLSRIYTHSNCLCTVPPSGTLISSSEQQRYPGTILVSRLANCSHFCFHIASKQRIHLFESTPQSPTFTQPTTIKHEALSIRILCEKDARHPSH